MKKILVLCVFVFGGIWAGASVSRAAQGDTGSASVYKVTITKLELNNGTSWVTVTDGSSTTLDIASVNSGEAVGEFFTGLSVPDGSYTQVRVTVSDTFSISGNVGSLYTTAAKSNGICVSTTTAADEAECTVEVPGGLPDPEADDLPATLTVSNGASSHIIRVNFDVSTAVQEGAANLLLPAEPTVTMTMIAL